MFVLRRKDDQRLFCMSGNDIAFVCQDRDVADRAIKEIKERFGVACYADDTDSTEISHYCFLRYPNGRKYGPVPGVSVICSSVEIALSYAIKLWENAGKTVRPLLVKSVI
jgi:hypothetical protein